MKTIVLWTAIILLLIWGKAVNAQQKEIVPDLSKINDPEVWTVNHWKAEGGKEVHINKKPGDGLVYLNDLIFGNGTIEVDIKGKNEQGRNFTGIAFHILNDSTYEAIYFRPFNFRNPESKTHSVQYISHPEFPWFKLREESPGIYENGLTPVPDPNNWFHATIIVEYPEVKVYVNHSKEPSLVINQLSDRKEGRLGFWVPIDTEGSFKNLKIIPAEK